MSNLCHYHCTQCDKEWVSTTQYKQCPYCEEPGTLEIEPYEVEPYEEKEIFDDCDN